MTYPVVPPAEWVHRLPRDLPASSIEKIKLPADEIGAASQYGWGHTIDFGPFRKEGLLRDAYLRIAGLLDAYSGDVDRPFRRNVTGRFRRVGAVVGFYSDRSRSVKIRIPDAVCRVSGRSSGTDGPTDA